MIEVKQKEIKKKWGLIENIDAKALLEDVRIYNEENHLVAMVRYESTFIKLKVPIDNMKNNLSFSMTKDVFLNFLKVCPGNKNRRLELTVEDDTLEVKAYKCSKGKPEELEDTYQFNVTTKRMPKKSNITYLASEVIELDDFLEFIRLTDTLKTNSQLYDYFNYGQFILADNQMQLYYADATALYRNVLNVKDNVEISDNVALFKLSDIQLYKKLIKNLVDINVQLLVSDKGILFKSDSVEFLFPLSHDAYPDIASLFYQEKETVMEIEDTSEFTLIKRKCKTGESHESKEFMMDGSLCSLVSNWDNALVVSYDKGDTPILEVCMPKNFTHRHRETVYQTVGFNLFKSEGIVSTLYQPNVKVVRMNEVEYLFVYDEHKEVLVLPMIVDAE